MKNRRIAFAALLGIGLLATGLYVGRAKAQMPPNRMARVLVVAETNGFEHDSVPDAMAAVYRMGHESRLWETTLRTDTENITKKDLQKGNFKSLNYFDALVFASTTGELNLTGDQKADMMSFIKDDGKGFVGIHAALDTNYKPEYGEMIGGWFNEHPWGTFNAPIILEDPGFPAVRHFPSAFVKHDEIYQAKEWSRGKVNVLLRLDETKLDFNNPRVHRDDHDFAVAWSKMHGKGRVFYSTLGHTKEAWDDPDIQKMYFEAIKWVLGMTEGRTTSHASHY
jgi:type 1 glutamine amidotransferase